MRPGDAGASAGALRRTLGLWQVTVSGVGVILGAGVYALVGPAAARAGGALWLAFVIAALAAGLTAYSYGRLAQRRPKDSPEFQYTTLAFGPRVGFVAGWLMLIADFLAAGAVALGFGGYLAYLAGTPIVLNAVVLLAVVALVLHVGISQSVGLAIALTVVEAAGLLFVIVLGLPQWPAADYGEMPHGTGGVWAAAALIFFAYLGFDELGNFAEEMRAPARDLPRALLLSLVITTAVYVLVALSAVAAAGWRDLSTSPAPLALVARRALGPGADTALALMALAATANTVLLLVLSASRSMYGMASEGRLPHRLARVGSRSTPVIAIWTALALTGLVVVGGDLVQAATLTDAAVLASFMLVNASLLWLARGRTRPVTPATLADIAIPGAALLMCGALLLHVGWLGVGAALALAGVGLALGRQRPAI
ncbi:MAG TPA: APC family permease [Methylomirabilota bacterium]|nr:APC family permease [Methylomirabilota bacterium]